MRYYRIELTNRTTGKPITVQSLAGSGLPPGVITSALPDKTTNPAALNIELDLMTYNGDIGSPASYLRIWGLGLAELSQAFNLNDQHIRVFGGMAKGLPLADPSQAGLLIEGEINQAFGNWIGTDQTLDIQFRAAGRSNYTFTWASGEKLSDMLARTLKTALPNAKQAINIKATRVANAEKPGAYSTFTQFAQAVMMMTETAPGEGDGVAMAFDGQTVRAYEATETKAGSNIKQIKFQDLLGQITWAAPLTIQAKMVMRGDLQMSQIIQFPKDLLVTTTAAAQPAFGGTGQNPSNKLSFGGDGKFQINQMQHWGNFRQPDAMSWNTTVWANPVK